MFWASAIGPNGATSASAVTRGSAATLRLRPAKGRHPTRRARRSGSSEVHPLPQRHPAANAASVGCGAGSCCYKPQRSATRPSPESAGADLAAEYMRREAGAPRAVAITGAPTGPPYSRKDITCSSPSATTRSPSVLPRSTVTASSSTLFQDGYPAPGRRCSLQCRGSRARHRASRRPLHRGQCIKAHSAIAAAAAPSVSARSASGVRSRGRRPSGATYNRFISQMPGRIERAQRAAPDC